MSALVRISGFLCLAAMSSNLLVAQDTGAHQPTRVGVIDVQRLVMESKTGKEVLDRLKNLREQKTAEGEALQQEAQDLQNRIQDSRLSLSEDRMVELEKELEDKLIELRRFADDADRILQQERDQAFARIEREVMPIISQVGAEQGFTLLFNKYESGLLYAADGVDTTNLILLRYDASVAGDS